MQGTVFAFIFVEVIGQRPLLGYMTGCLRLVFRFFFCVSRLFETSIYYLARGA